MSIDRMELQHQAKEILALIENLRPEPSATLVSRKKLQLLAAISGDDDLLKLADHADENTLFWESEGEYIEQKVSLVEMPLA